MKMLILFLMLFNLSPSMTSEEYWTALNKRAGEIYGGLDILSQLM